MRRPVDPRPRRRERPLTRGRVSIGLTAAFLLASCGSADTADSAGSSTSVVETTAAGATTLPPLTTPAPTTTVAPPPPTTAAPTTVAETTTTVPAPADPTVLVASDQGIVRIKGDTTTIITGEPASVAVQVDATVYFQSESGSYGGQSDDNAATAIRWIDPTGVKTLLTPGPGEFLRLHSAGSGPDGTPLLVYSVIRGDGPPLEENPDPLQELLFIYDIATSSSVPLGEIGGWEYGTGPLRLGGELLVGTASAEASHSLLMLGLDGNDRSDPAKFGLEESYSDCSDCPTAFTVDSAGALLAWVDNGVVTFADTTSGDTLATLAVPAGYYSDAQVQDLRMVLNRPELPGLIIDISTGSVAQLPTGYATLVPG